MKEIFEKKQKKGFTLVESVMSIGIFIILAGIVYQTITALIHQSGLYRENTTLSSIASQYLEVVRNLPYSKVGTINGNPNGPLPDLPNATTTTAGNIQYKMYYAVSYVDDPSDGTILAGTDSAPNDYKQIKFYIKNTATNAVSSFLTNVAPSGLEGLASGGALSIKVFNSLGIAIPNVIVNITNTAVTPNINVTRLTDINGNWAEVGLPSKANSYHISVSKNGYSSDQTYPTSAQYPNPTKPDSTVSSGQVTQVSFSIDTLSNLTLHTVDQMCSSTPETGIGLKGEKLISGTSTSDPEAVFKFNNTYSSGADGQVVINNIEWDNYSPSSVTTNHMLYGSSPIQPIALAAGASQEATFIYGPKTTNSLLVIVRDSVTKTAIATSTIRLKKGSTDISTTTTSGGPCPTLGQAMFSDIPSGQNYTVTITSSEYVTKTISGVSVDGNNLLQVPMSK